MRGLQGLIRLNRWKLAAMRRRLDELEGLATSLKGERDKLAAELVSEGTAAAADFESGRAYSAYVAGAVSRRQSLEDSLEELQEQIYAAHAEVGAAYAEVKRFEIAAQQRRDEAERSRKRREQAVYDEIGIDRHRRAGR